MGNWSLLQKNTNLWYREDIGRYIPLEMLQPSISIPAQASDPKLKNWI